MSGRELDHTRPIRKRNRPTTSCIPCHNRHIKCSRTVPCLSCIQGDRKAECRFFNQVSREAPSFRPERSAMVHTHSELSVARGRSNTMDKFYHPPSLNRKFSAPQSSSFIVDAASASHDATNRPFVKFLSEFETSWPSAVLSGATPSVIGNKQHELCYTAEMEAEIKQACWSMPLNFTRTKQLLQKAIDLGGWSHCYSECAEVLSHLQREALPRLLRQEQYKESSQSTDLLEDSLTNQYQIGDASKLCLIIAMMLSVVQLSSSTLISLCYDDHPLIFRNSLGSGDLSLSSGESARKQIIQILERHFRILLRISKAKDVFEKKEDKDEYEPHADSAIRGAMMHIYYLKNADQFNQEVAQRFMDELAQLVINAGLHCVDSSESGQRSFSTNKEQEAKIERRRRLFYQFYVLERVSAAHFGLQTKFREKIQTRLPLPLESKTDTMRIRIDLADILNDASGLLHHGATSYDEIQAVEERFSAAWQRYLSARYGRNQAEDINGSPKTLVEALQRLMFTSARVLIHRLCFFGKLVESKAAQTGVQQSRQLCLESGKMAVEAAEALRFLMHSDELMCCFQVAWIPAEQVISLLLMSLMAVSEELSLNQQREHSPPNNNSLRISELLLNHQQCQDLASRLQKLLANAPSNSILPQKSMETLSRVQRKADFVIHGLVAKGITGKGYISSEEGEPNLPSLSASTSPCSFNEDTPSILFDEIGKRQKLSYFETQIPERNNTFSLSSNMQSQIANEKDQERNLFADGKSSLSSFISRTTDAVHTSQEYASTPSQTFSSPLPFTSPIAWPRQSVVEERITNSIGESKTGFTAALASNVDFAFPPWTATMSSVTSSSIEAEIDSWMSLLG